MVLAFRFSMRAGSVRVDAFEVGNLVELVSGDDEFRV